jgi:TolB-like protein
VVNLHTEELGNPAVPEKLKVARVAAAALRKRTAFRWLSLGVMSLLAMIAVIGFLLFRYKRPLAPRESLVSEKSIAVLPFENRSEDKANAYFADGIQDEILTRLSKIADLKVISRTSTEKYRSRPDNLKTIAEELGVATILEGSVQKAGETVHITVQLLSGHTDAHLWAESYDRELKNIFEVEREVAETVAAQLKAKLLPQEATELARVPTTNPQAYDLYLRAKYIDQQMTRGQVDSDKPAVDFCRQAIALDPGFALAYALLAKAEFRVYGAGDRSPERVAAMQANAEKSLALQPDLIEGHLARAAIYAFVKHDNASALAEYESALKRSPNDPALTASIALLKELAGDWEAALTGMLRACELDPRNSKYLRWVGDIYSFSRRYAEADKTYEKALALEPDDWFARGNRANNLIIQGKLADAREALKAWPDTKLTKTALSTKYSNLQQIETLSRNYDAALTYGLKIPVMDNRFTTGFSVGDVKKNTDIGFDALYKGDTAGAHQAFTAAREGLESKRASHLDDPDFYNAEALIAAGMDNREAAVKAARKAVALVPIETDAVLGALCLLTLAQVYAHFGDADQAVPLIGKLLDTRTSAGQNFSPALLRLDPIWDPIRDDPRFEKLCSQKDP